MEKQDAIAALAALAQETRLDVFRLLVSDGAEGMAAGAIAQALGLPAATLSFHLKELTRAELITFRREGRSIIYSLRPHGIRDLLAYLTQDCCQGRPELCC